MFYHYTEVSKNQAYPFESYGNDQRLRNDAYTL